MLSGGSGSCSPTSSTALAPGTSPYDLTATYSGDTNFEGSVGTGPGSLTVTSAKTSTKISVAPSTVVAGAESDAVFSAVVRPEFAGYSPKGTVVVTVDGITLCSIFLQHGRGSCSPPDTALPARVAPYRVTATYLVDADFLTSSGGTNLRVNPAP